MHRPWWADSADYYFYDHFVSLCRAIIAIATSFASSGARSVPVSFIALKALSDKALSIFARVYTSDTQISYSNFGLVAEIGSQVVISNTACARRCCYS